MYVRTLLAQAGVINSEVSGGEDHLAVDLSVIFPVGTATVQVKTGTEIPNQDGSISVSTNEEWREKWSTTTSPVYLVYVRLEKIPPTEWIDHPELHTVLHARAQWLRVNNLSVPTAKLPAENRLTVSTFDEWTGHFYQTFGEVESA